MADRRVSVDIIARDRASREFQKAAASADSLNSRVRNLSKGFPALRAAALGVGPAIVPVMAAASAAAVGMGTALASAGAAAGVFGAVTKSAFAEVKTASDKSSDLRDKVRLLKQEAAISGDSVLSAKYMKKAADAQREYDARLSLLPPTTRGVVRAYDAMKSSWQDFVDRNKPAVYGVMTKGFDAIGRHVSDLQPLFDVGARFASRWVNSISGWVDGGGLSRVVAFLSANAVPALNNLTTIFRSLATVAGNVMNAAVFSESGGLLGWLARGSAALAKWSGGNGLTRLMGYLEKNGPQVTSALSSLAGAAVHIAQAVGPLAPISLAVASALAKIIAAIPPRVLTVLVGAYLAFSIALNAVGAASKLAAGAQLLLNAVMSANPIGIVIVAIVALTAAVVIAYKRSETFRRIVNAAFTTIRNAGLDMWRNLQRAFNGITSAISGTFNWVRHNWPLLLAILTGPIGLAALAIARNWDRIRSSAVSAFNGVVSFARGIPGKIKGAFAGAGKLLTGIGSAIIGSLFSGVRSAMGNVGQVLSDVKDKIVGGLKHLFGINSPSTVMAELGGHMITGLIKGMLVNSGALASTAKNIGASVLDNVGKAGLFGGGGALLSKLFGGGGGGGNSANRALGQRMAAAYGWTGAQWSALNALIMGESGWNNNAQNPTSTAYGIGQFLNSTWATVGLQKSSDAGTQIAGLLQYVRQSYGDPINALSKWQSRSPHWYAKGMAPTVFSQPTLIGVGERGPETVSVVPHGRSGGRSGDVEVVAPLVIQLDAKTLIQAQVRYKRVNGISSLGLA